MLELQLNLWPSGHHRLSDHCHVFVRLWVKHSVPQCLCHLLSPPTLCSCKSNLFFCESNSSPCIASNLAHVISVCSHCCHACIVQFTTDRGTAAHPWTHMQTPRRRTLSYHSLLRSQMMAQDRSAGDSFSCESTWEIQWSVFSRRVEGTDAWWRESEGSGKQRDVLCTQSTLQMSPLSICCVLKEPEFSLPSL